jgi:hypothetical protein
LKLVCKWLKGKNLTGILKLILYGCIGPVKETEMGPGNTKTKRRPRNKTKQEQSRHFNPTKPKVKDMTV